MPKEDALDYDKLKCALLKSYELNDEWFNASIKSVDRSLAKLFSNLQHARRVINSMD